MYNRIFITVLFLSISLFLVYYVFIDTLTISQIVGNTNNPKVDIFVNIFDFDTDLTRYDLYRLSQKGDYWNMRMQQVLSIKNPRERELEQQKLFAEMMQDRSMKKVAKKLLGMGEKSASVILRAAKELKTFGIL